MSNNLIEKKKNFNFKNLKIFRNGSVHNLLLFSENGKEKLYGFGYNGSKQLGTSQHLNFSDLTEIPYFNDKKIKNIECGQGHNLILLGFIYFLFIYLFIFFLIFF